MILHILFQVSHLCLSPPWHQNNSNREGDHVYKNEEALFWGNSGASSLRRRVTGKRGLQGDSREPHEGPTVCCLIQSGTWLTATCPHSSGGRRANPTNSISQSQDTIGTGTVNREASLRQTAVRGTMPRVEKRNPPYYEIRETSANRCRCSFWADATALLKNPC